MEEIVNKINGRMKKDYKLPSKSGQDNELTIRIPEKVIYRAFLQRFCNE